MSDSSLQIRSFILRKFPVAKKRAFDDDVALLESGIIDSLGVLDVVTFLEQSFSIKVEDEELTPENFGSIHSMATFVEQKRAGPTVPSVDCQVSVE